MQYNKIHVDQTINIAFLGCGGVTVKHVKTLKGFNGVKKYFASRSLEKASQYSKKWNGAGFFGSYEEAIASEDVNVVLIATPPDSHFDLGRKPQN